MQGRRKCQRKFTRQLIQMNVDKVRVMQIRIRMYVLKDIPVHKVQTELAAFLDQELIKDERFAKLHQENKFKMYTYDSLYPVEEDKIYKKNKIYTLTIRTVDMKLAKYFAEQVVDGHTETVKALTSEVKVIPQKHIELLYTLTPAILKCENGYWKDTLSVNQYEERLKINLLKKWAQFYGEKLSEEFEMFNGIEFLNKVPVSSEYKNVHLLTDKLCLHIAENETAQNLAQLAIGTGIAEMNSRGYGFCNYRWL